MKRGQWLALAVGTAAALLLALSCSSFSPYIPVEVIEHIERRSEDPEFTVREAKRWTWWPGAEEREIVVTRQEAQQLLRRDPDNLGFLGLGKIRTCLRSSP